MKLPLPSSCVILVDDNDTLQFAFEVLLYEGNVSRIALDAEWRPTSTLSTLMRCALLQIACDSHVFLFDLLTLETLDLDDELDELLVDLFTNEAILKLGCVLETDLQRLRLSFSTVDLVNVLDFAHASDFVLTARRRLSALVEERLGSPLDKSQQCSDWEQRPLTAEQIDYAALDAYCLLMLQRSS